MLNSKGELATNKNKHTFIRNRNSRYEGTVRTTGAEVDYLRKKKTWESHQPPTSSILKLKLKCVKSILTSYLQYPKTELIALAHFITKLTEEKFAVVESRKRPTGVLARVVGNLLNKILQKFPGSQWCAIAHIEYCKGEKKRVNINEEPVI